MDQYKFYFAFQHAYMRDPVSIIEDNLEPSDSVFSIKIVLLHFFLYAFSVDCELLFKEVRERSLTLYNILRPIQTMHGGLSFNAMWGVDIGAISVYPYKNCFLIVFGPPSIFLYNVFLHVVLSRDFLPFLLTDL